MGEGKYVVFRLEEETYGIEIMKVKEITEYRKTTKIPRAPEFVDGVINLRGSIVPIINLKKKFRLKSGVIKENSRVIVVNREERLLGFLVDEALQVITLAKEDIDDTPDIVAEINASRIMGIGRIGEQIIIILDFAAILSEKEKGLLSKMDC